MTNRLAIILVLMIIAAVTADIMLYDARNLLFLGQKFFELIEWIAFWR